MTRTPARAAPLLAALALAACASTPPGQDTQGEEYKAAALPVLQALVAYHKDKGRYPTSVYELTPRYLKDVPLRPNLAFDPDGKTVGFVYEIAGLRFRSVACLAEFGQVEWTCRSLD